MTMDQMTVDALYGKQEQVRALFGPFYTEVLEARRFYDLAFASDVVPARWAEKLTALIPPTARHAVDEAVDHILFTPRIKVQRRPSEPEKNIQEQQIAEKKRQALGAWWNYVNSNMNIMGDARKTLINEGKVAIRMTLKWDMIPTSPPSGQEYKRARAAYREKVKNLGEDCFLWDLEILDNVSLAESPSNHREPPYAYIKYMIYREDAKRMFPMDMPSPTEDPDSETGEAVSSTHGVWRDGNDLEKVEYSEFWSADEHDADGVTIGGRLVRWIEGVRVHDAENPYGFVPIAIEDAGFGTVRAGSAPEEKFVGMTQFMRPIFKAEAIQMTSWEAVAELTAFGLYTSRNRDENKSINMGPGEIIALEGDAGQPGAEMFEAVKLPEIPAGVLQLVEKTTQLANDSLKMRTLGGQPLAGVETATEADQQIRNASAKLANPVAAMERLCARLSRWFLMTIDNCIEAPVTIFAAGLDSNEPASVTLGPDDIRGFYEVSAELRTTDQEAVNMVKARFWAEMYRLVPFLSAYTAMERGEISDKPEREMKQRDAEDIFRSPEMQMVRKLTAAQSFQQFAEFVMNMASGGQPAGPPAPGGEGGGGFPSEPTAQLDDVVPAGASVPSAVPGGAGANRDIIQGASQIRG